ncbi:MAG: N-acetylmuramoyl-L-alanine amidase [Pseudanabaenaceae cyanobacterium]
MIYLSGGVDKVLRVGRLVLLGIATVIGIWLIGASPRLHLSYPPQGHTTTSHRLFFIGTAPPQGNVTINGQVIKRTPDGHFAPSLPLRLGVNDFTVRYQAQEIKVKVLRLPAQPPPPSDLGFVPDSLTPDRHQQIQVNELFCFRAIATPNRKVSVTLGDQTIALAPDPSPTLPPNSAILTASNQPGAPITGKYQGCTRFTKAGQLGQATFRITDGQRTVTAQSRGTVEVQSAQFAIAIVTTENATTRTGASSDFSRLTPQPKGVQAVITGKSGDWWRLDYGAWIANKDVEVKSSPQLPRSVVRSLQVRQAGHFSEVLIPLQVPLPIAIHQDQDRLFLTIHNATAQTDTIKQPNFNDPIIASILWEQPDPQRVVYTIRTRTKQQWGYQVTYRGTTLVLAVRHPPQASIPPTVVIDAGHGGPEDVGAVSPTGLREKTVTLTMGQLLAQELTRRSVRVVMTRTTDVDMDLPERVAIIDRTAPTLALSIHYNALPDHGDAENTAGIGTFWYHSQSQQVAQFLHPYLVKHLQRPDYGMYWANLAMVRPTIAPCLLLELGFLINPTEFKWITDPQAQRRTAQVLADGIYAWLRSAIVNNA